MALSSTDRPKKEKNGKKSELIDSVNQEQLVRVCLYEASVTCATRPFASWEKGRLLVWKAEYGRHC